MRWSWCHSDLPICRSCKPRHVPLTHVCLISIKLSQILDWYKKNTEKDYVGDEDPGVQSVKKIFNYYKQHHYKTIVMGASFRNVRSHDFRSLHRPLTGVIFPRSERSKPLLVSTSWLSPLLSLRNWKIPRILFLKNWILQPVCHLSPSARPSVQWSDFRNSQIAAQADPIAKVTYVDNEPEFRWALLQDQMAFDKLHEGIKKFAEDGEKLKKLLRAKISG